MESWVRVHWLMVAAVISSLVALPAAAEQGAKSPRSSLDTHQIEQLAGAKGKLEEKEGVFKVSVPRTDLQVTAAGVKITPALGLTCWAAFEGAPQHTTVMGDMVLTENQVNPVMSVALDNGLEVTALHNHFFWESPRVMFMHFGGMGDEKTLASAVGKVFAKIKETSGDASEPPKVQVDPAQTSVDGSKIDAILGARGKIDGGIYKTTIGRTTRMHGAEAGNAMGVNTWAAFAGSDDNAIVDGDFAMLESELQPVLKALRKAGINIVAIHQHMTGEQPRILFLHYWGVGATQDLARGLRSALDRTATRLSAR
ncbi:MAG TPA: DUF1259 domain-containing protein [Anaeromyxobacteraceae bacterium]|nr:DUF1259 domain-containing protein [Anaeromyxobacteraceae bacterium]